MPPQHFIESIMLKYLKHASLTCLIVPAAISALLFAPKWAFLIPVAITLVNLVIDMGTPPDTEVPSYKHLWILDSWVYLYIPIIGLYFFSLFWLASPVDFLGFGKAVHDAIGVDVVRIKADAGLRGVLAGTFAVGYVLSSNHLYAHELVHRTSDRVAMIMGRWLLAMSGDAQFSISHVYAHHAHVGTAADSATARRGESVYRFFVRSSLGQYKESWNLEAARLRVKGYSAFSWRNRVLTGLSMSVAYGLFAYAAAGVTGVQIYLAIAVAAKFIFEVVNYIEHYGVVRVPGTPVMPRHSWDCNRRFASNALLNLARHADHHANAQKKYWQLHSHDTPLQLHYGYIATIIVAMIPAWWHRFAARQLIEWDDRSATPDERLLAKQANLLSRHTLFVKF